MHTPLLAILSFLLTTISLAHPLIISTPPSSPSHSSCAHLIATSHHPRFNWTSPSALSLAQCLLHTSPPPSTCVFYTSNSKLNAIRYAYESNLTTIYDVYSPRHFDTSIDPMRRWQRDGHQRDLFRITSKAYALACSGKASVVMPEDETVCPESIWVTDEYEVIRSGEGRIELPVWRVSWVEDVGSGIWRWVRTVLGKGKEKRDGNGGLDEQMVMIEGVVEDVRVEVARKMEMVKKLWDLGREEVEAAAEDLWALSGSRCGR